MSAASIGETLTVNRGGDRVNRVGTIVELCFVIAASILFNLFPDRIGYYPSLAEPWRFTPILAPEFWIHLPMLNLYWILLCNLCIMNLAMRDWQIFRLWADAWAKVLGVFIMIQMVLGGPLTLFPWIDQWVKLGLTVAIIPASISAISAARRAVGTGLKVA